MCSTEHTKFQFFIFSPILLQTLDLDNFVSFYFFILFDLFEIWYADLSYCILFFSLQCCYQLSKAKKLLGKNHFFSIFFTFKGA